MAAIILERSGRRVKISGPMALITDALAYLNAGSNFSTSWVWDIQPGITTITGVTDDEKYATTRMRLREWAAFITQDKVTKTTVEGQGNRIVLRNLPEY